jgi:uncharacterized protein YndB with AHSA1/START domain
MTTPTPPTPTPTPTKTPTPTGRVVRSSDAFDLVLERQFRAPIDDVWESVTTPESTARWYGRWEGTPGAGNVIRVQMAFEKGEPWSDMTITACEKPRHFALHSKHDYGEFFLDLALTHAAGTTTLTFTQRRFDPAMAGDMGPGWEYYLDNLVAARAGEKLPVFTDYYPSQTEYYRAAAAGA